MYNDIKDIILEMNKLQSMNYLIAEEEIEYIIDNKIIDSNKIEHLFDKILDLSFLYGNEVDKLFYKLYDYYKNIDINISLDYKDYYTKVLKR